MRKNILILGHSDATQFVDVYNQYCRLFNPSEYKITVAYLTHKHGALTRERTIAEEVIFLNTTSGQLAGLKIRAIYQLYKLCREQRYEIVICHRYKPSYIMLLVSLFCTIKAVVCVMHELHTMQSFRRRAFIALFNRRHIYFAGVSNAVRDDLRQTLWFIPHERIITLYNVLDIALTEPQLLSRTDARAALSLSDSDIVFGNLARLVPNKDHESLLTAFAAMKATCPHAKLVIIGDGKLEKHLKSYTRVLGLENDVLFTGYVTGGYRYMRAFDCFVLSSVQEAFGRVLLEAMVAKIPIIATTANGIPEVVGTVGALIPPKHVDHLAKAMTQYYHLTHDERSNLGHVAYRHLHAHFSIPAFQQQFWQALTTKG